jgi:hypothetical protein
MITMGIAMDGDRGVGVRIPTKTISSSVNQTSSTSTLKLKIYREVKGHTSIRRTLLPGLEAWGVGGTDTKSWRQSLAPNMESTTEKASQPNPTRDKMV